VNNALDQRNGIGSINYNTPDLTAFLTLSGDDQRLGLPGGRLVQASIGLNELATDRRGTSTPFDYGNKQGANATAGFTRTLWNGAELIVDGGVRDKKQQGGFFGPTPTPSFTSSYIDSTLQTWSLTPRLSIKNPMFGTPSAILTGIDYYDATYHADHGTFKGLPPIGRLLAANGRTVADHRFFVWRAGPKYQAERAGSFRPDGTVRFRHAGVAARQQ
jgi:iron complex outermembrane receptor protein